MYFNSRVLLALETCLPSAVLNSGCVSGHNFLILDNRNNISLYFVSLAMILVNLVAPFVSRLPFRLVIWYRKDKSTMNHLK